MAKSLSNNLWKFHQKILNYSENNEIFVGGLFFKAAPCTIVHPVPITGFMQPLQTNDFITLYMLPFKPQHFLCTYFWQAAHCIDTSITDTTWPSYSLLHHLLPFSTNRNLHFILIYSRASILHIPLIRSSSVSATTTKSSEYNSHGNATLNSLDKASITITNSTKWVC